MHTKRKMMKKSTIVLTSSFFMAASMNAVIAADHKHHEHKHDHEEKQSKQLSAHEHGVAKMNIAALGKEVQIQLESPAFNVVGFEHQPKTKKQKKLVKKVEKLLAKPNRLISIGAASCTVEHVKVNSPFAKDDHLDHSGHKHHDDHKDEHKEHKEHKAHKEHEGHKGTHKGHDEHDHDKHAEEGQDTHSEYALEYHFICDSNQITTVDFSGLFSNFSKFSKIRTQWLSDDKQGAAELSASNQVISLK